MCVQHLFILIKKMKRNILYIYIYKSKQRIEIHVQRRNINADINTRLTSILKTNHAAIICLSSEDY